MLTLDQLSPGHRAVVTALNLDSEISRRLAVFGLTLGKAICIKHAAPLGGPLVLSIGSTSLLLRRTLAQAIQVKAA